MATVLSVVESARFIASNSQQVHINRNAIAQAAHNLLPQIIRQNGEDPVNQVQVVVTTDPLEPSSLSEEEILEWLFLVDVLNFCFWSDEPTLFTVNHLGMAWTGYRSLCAALCRAKSDGVPVHKPEFYRTVSRKQMEHIFRSDSHMQLSLLEKRRSVLHEAGAVIREKFGGRVTELISQCDKSAQKLVHLLTTNFSSFCDTATYHGRPVSLLKRAQIFAADVWNRFGGRGYGEFHDIDTLTMFADYRVPQTLLYLDILSYEPSLMEKLRAGTHLLPGSPEEVEIRGCSIWAVEILKETMLELMSERENPRFEGNLLSIVNSVTLDFYLWNYAKSNSSQMSEFPIHRTLTHFY